MIGRIQYPHLILPSHWLNVSVCSVCRHYKVRIAGQYYVSVQAVLGVCDRRVGTLETGSEGELGHLTLSHS